MGAKCRHCGGDWGSHEAGHSNQCQTKESIKRAEPENREWAQTFFEPMPDQADDLRRLVATRGRSKIQEVLEELELSDDGTTHDQPWATQIADPAEWIKSAPGEGLSFLAESKGIAPPHPDKAKLWDDLKASLLAEASRGACPPLRYGHNSDDIIESAAEAQRQFDRMEQAETLARVRFVDTPSPRGVPAPVPPPTDETFETVREGLRTGGGRDD